MSRHKWKNLCVTVKTDYNQILEIVQNINEHIEKDIFGNAGFLDHSITACEYRVIHELKFYL